MVPESQAMSGRDATLSVRAAYLAAGLVLAGSAAVFFGLFRLRWPELVVTRADLGLTLGAFLAGTLLHEGLHAAGFRIFGGLGAQDVGFGMRAGLLHAHARAPMTASAYRWSAVLPSAVTAVLGLMGIAIGSVWLTLTCINLLGAAGGDLAVWWAIRKVPATALVKDHPAAVGCVVL